MMKLKKLFKIFCFFCLTSSSFPAQSFNFFFKDELKCQKKNYSLEKLYSLAKKGVVVITTPSGIGSGFVIKHKSNKTYILTNSHVVNKNKKVLVTWADNKKNGAFLVLDGIDRRFDSFEKVGNPNFKKDLALLVVKKKKGTPLNFSNESIPVGREVITIGSPSGLDYSLTRGIVSGIRSDGNMIQTDAAINEGNSGGPLLGLNGCVVGVNTFKFLGKEGLNFALSKKAFASFFKKVPTENYINEKLSGEDLSLSGLAKFHGREINITSKGTIFPFERSDEILKSAGSTTIFSFPRFLKKDHAESLINRYSFAIKLDPGNYKNYLERGRIKSWLANWYIGQASANTSRAKSDSWMVGYREEALDDLDKVIELNPYLLAPYFYKAKYIYDFGYLGGEFANDYKNRDKNIQILKEKKAVTDEDYFYKSNAFRNEPTVGLKLIRKATKLNPNHLYYFHKATFEEKLSKYDEALKSIEMAIDSHKNEYESTRPRTYALKKFNLLKKFDKKTALKFGKSMVDGKYKYGISKFDYGYIFPITSLAKELNDLEWSCKIYNKINIENIKRGYSTSISVGRLKTNNCQIDNNPVKTYAEMELEQNEMRKETDKILKKYYGNKY